MKIHINQILPEGLDIEGEDPASILELNDPSIKPLSGIRYALHVGLSDGGIFATGTLGMDLEMECVTCLTRFRYPLRVPDFALQTELTGPETVDLTEFVREDIFLALPPHPHCDWNGENVCRGARTERIARVEDEPKPEAWAALDQLKLKPKN